MNKKTLIYFFVFILLISFVSPAQPITTIFTGDVGYELTAPVSPYLQVNEVNYLSVHVFNKSDGGSVTDKHASCMGYIYNHVGFEIGKFQADFSGDQFNFSTQKNSITEPGEYAYTVHCNSSNIGGYVSGYFIANIDGLEPKDYSYTGLAIALILISFLFIYFAFKLNEKFFLLQLLLIFFALYILILIPTLYINGIPATAQTLLRLNLAFFRLFIVYFFIYLTYHWFNRTELFMKTLGKIGKWQKK